MKGWLVVNSFLSTTKFIELYQYLKKSAEKYDITLDIVRSTELVGALKEDFLTRQKPDFVLFWDKDIYLAQRLEGLGFRLFNSARAVELCDNKILTALVIGDAVKMPRTVIVPKTFEGIGYNDKNFVKKAVELLGLPVVVKEAYGSFGQQVYLCHSIEDIESTLDKIGYKDCLMQEFISSSIGRDVRVNVVGGKVVCAMLRKNDNDFRSNITNGGSMQPYQITKEFEDIALKATQILGLDFAGVDIMFGKSGEGILCEVNASPHFKSSLVATGIDVSQRIMEYIARVLR